MKKFFTLCLMFLVVGVLNLSAGYVLSGENVNGESWNHSSTTNTFAADENGDLVLKGVSISGEFLVTDGTNWYKPIWDAQLVSGVPVIMNTENSNNCKCATAYSNCTIKLTELSATAVAVEIISTDTQDVEVAQLGESWGMMGNFNGWSSDLVLTKKEYGVYEAWIDETTVNGLVGQSFKFRVDSDWDKGEFGSAGLTYNFNEWNILQRGGGDITTLAQPAESYDKYLLTLVVKGSSAKFRIDGFKDATPIDNTASVIFKAPNASVDGGLSFPTTKSSASSEYLTMSNGFTLNDVNVKFDNGTNSNESYCDGSEVRFYQGANLYVTPLNGQTITKIQIKQGSKKGNLTIDGTNVDVVDGFYVWEGSATNTISFSNDAQIRFPYMTVTYGSKEETPSWAPVFEGVENNGTYYNSVMYNINASGAEKLDVTMKKNGEIFWETSTTYIPFNNGADAGEWEITATAWKGNEYITSTVAFTVETVESVYNLSEFIGTSGKRHYKFNNIYVLAQSGKYTYIKDNSRSILIYGVAPEFKVGDYLQEFIAEYKEYYGLHELIPVQFGQVYGNTPQEPEVITIDQVTTENQSKFVKLTGLTLSSADGENYTLDGISVYNRFNTELPTDLTKKYDVTAIVGMYQGAVQLEPITFEEAQPVVALNPQTIEPAEGEVESLNTITLTFAEKTSINAETEEVITLKCDSDPDYNYGKDLTVTMSEDGLTATITSTPSYSSWTVGKTYSLEVPAGYFTAIGAASEALKYSWTITSPKIRYSEVTPAQGSEVYELSEVVLTFPKNVYGLNFSPLPSVNILDAEGNVVTTVSTAYGDSKNILKIAIDPAITTPGTYSIVLAADKLGDDQFYGGNHNAEIVLNYTVIENPLKLDLIPYATVPTAGTEVDALTKVTLWFPDDATPSDMNWFITEKPSVVDQDGNTYTASIDYTSYTEAYYVYINDVTNPGTYTLTIPQGTFGDDDYFNTQPYNTIGRANPELTYTWTIKAAPIAPTAVDPANGAEVSDLNTTVITFAEAVTVNAEVGAITLVRDSDPGWDKQDAVVTISEDGLTATITCQPVYPSYEPKWYTGETYTMSIPAGYFVAASGATNDALSYTWTVAAPKFTYVSTTPANGSTVESLSEILICFAQRTYGYGSLPTLNLVDAEGNVVTTATTARTTDADGNWYAIKATLAQTVTAPGTYTLVVPENAFTDVDFGDSGNKSAAFDLTFTIAEPDPNTYTLALNVDPADGSTVTALDKIVFTPGAGVVVAMATTEALGANWFTVTDAEGNSYNSQLALEAGTSGYGLTIEGATAAGTYTVVVPKKSFYDALNATNYNAEMTLTYTVDSNTYDFAWTVNPAEGEVEELTKLVFTAATAGQIAMPTNQAKSDNWVKVVDANGNVYNTTAIGGTGYDVTIEGATAPGTYTVTVPKGSFYDMMASLSGTMNFNDEIVLTYTIKAAEVVEDFTPVVTPVAGNITVDQIKKTVITLPSKFGSYDSSCDPWYNQMYIKRYELGSEKCFWSKTMADISESEDGLTITLEWDATFVEGTEYTFCIPAGYIVLENGAKNLATEVTYTVVAPDPYTYTYGISEISPAEGTVTELGNQIFMTATGDWFEFTPTAYTTPNWIKLVDDKGKTYNTGVGYVTETQAVVYVMNDENTGSLVITEPGTYTMTIPQGTFGDRTFYESSSEKGNLNPELVYTWTIEAPKDFTPEVNPIAGEVTKEDIKTTVITFPSPIASFDGSNVRYAKNLGSVWYDIAATSTISEDKLSMTINWDFAPEVGLTYTLELPAGCIVLENGAKNLETNVAYVVVAGPKDLAEFTVPAGLTGWLNYDASDVNAWAPEFPFTVSTSQNNTIAFTATLPSLPTGLTSMEIINDNNEVIATLNQSGVTPLAEGGEEYTVLGETTNEYVEGSELRFRFRFAHAGGTSETILFSYIVAGGTVTGADAIELDGNVIVRGNEIIAPEGSAIYTISGIQVPAEGLAPGVYVVVLGNQAVKVMVK